MKSRTVLVIMLTLASCGGPWLTPAFSQNKSDSVKTESDPTPKLKDSIRADIRDAQLKISNLQLQFQQIMQQYSTDLQTKLATALKDSGIDDTKWQLDPSTLTVVPRVVDTSTTPKTSK